MNAGVRFGYLYWLSNRDQCLTDYCWTMNLLKSKLLCRLLNLDTFLSHDSVVGKYVGVRMPRRYSTRIAIQRVIMTRVTVQSEMLQSWIMAWGHISTWNYDQSNSKWNYDPESHSMYNCEPNHNFPWNHDAVCGIRTQNHNSTWNYDTKP